MRGLGVQLQGIADTFRAGRVPARALAIADSRTLVRSMFLASAVRSDLLRVLRGGRSFPEIVNHTGCTRPERLEAWLSVGCELGELSHRRERYGVRGARARALAGGDPLLVAHYRSMLDYQIGPYGELDELLHGGLGGGRDDLARCADDIAQVSLAASPFVSSFVRQLVTRLHPSCVLDIGCGTGVYSKVVLETDLDARVEAIDLAPEVIATARAGLEGAGYGSRIGLHVGDAHRWVRESSLRFDLVMLLNNVYYFDRSRRAELYRDIGEILTDSGQLAIASMTAPGSIAAAHLHFMLTSQAAAASLPGAGEIENDLLEAGFEVLASERLVPSEPFVGVTAVRQ